MATTGTSGKDTLSGGTGDDTLRGFLGDDTYTYHLGNGADTVIDSGGSDTLLVGDPMGVYSGMDVYRSTSGTDLVFDFGSAGKVILQKQFSTTTATPASRIEFLSLEDEPGMKLVFANGLKGTNKNDLIVGKATADNIAGGAGNDWIFGGAGNDTLSGGDGDDELHGGAGNDQLDGGLGDDYFNSGAGNDKVNGGDGHDEITYVGQSDGIFVNMTGAMQAFNGKQVDNGKVYEKATSTFDTLNSIESLDGTRYADVVAFGQFNSTSNLSVSLGQGNDTVTGTLAGSNSYASIHVGYWDDPNGVIVNLSDAAIEVKLGDALHTVAARSARDGWGDTDTFQFSGQQHISIGDSDHDDYIRGQDATGPNMSWEWFNTGRGNDTIDGGTGLGMDTISYSAWDKSNFGVIVNLSQNSIAVGGVTVQAGTARDNWGYTDTLLNIEAINGSSMNDYVLGSVGDNNLMGGTGKDTLLGGDGNDFIDGNDGNDSLLGGNGFDQITGEEGNDTLWGGDGSDNLQGGNGDDLIIGGAGTDNMDGGAGNDVFKFNSLADLAGGSDGFSTIESIYSFVHGEDKIDLSAIDANPNMAGKQAFTFLDAMPTTGFMPGQIWLLGNSLMINMNKDFAAEYQLLVLQQPGQAPLSASDFIFA